MDNALNNLPPEIEVPIQLALATFVKEDLNVLYLIIIASLWLGISLSLFVALLYISGPQTYRKPIFILCVIAVALGTIPSILYLKFLIQVFSGRGKRSLAEQVKSYLIALEFFSFFTSVFIDSILFFRLVVIFPSTLLPSKKLAAIFGPLLFMKLGRITTLILFIVQYLDKTKTLPSDDPLIFFPVVKDMPAIRAVWGLQIIDNAICSFLFIYRLHQIKSFSLRLSNSSYRQRLRTLLLISISNFVFPVIFVIIQLNLMEYSTNFNLLAGINISATNVEVIGVLFATMWASQAEGGNWRQGQHTDVVSDDIQMPTLPAMSTGSSNPVGSVRQQGVGAGKEKSQSIHEFRGTDRQQSN
ncbi:hypothetical protein K435DRAFT_869486 [Dendrothele bispora CBS 962.96]|uniref:Uncharacterized protein n=1 Tax=Dendrothele bispora (strain CBS 962.96) TaxID=1314807 RepID=A0A4S8L931_DENBC|nr:hypothetical protein K435DRAFT_869486 [Dendrothele bispora CBS 962.96]